MQQPSFDCTRHPHVAIARNGCPRGARVKIDSTRPLYVCSRSSTGPRGVTCTASVACRIACRVRYGGNFAIWPYVTADLFGAARCGVNYGMIFTFYAVTSGAALIGLTFLIDPSSPELTFSLAAIQALGTLLALTLGRLRAVALASRRGGAVSRGGDGMGRGQEPSANSPLTGGA